MPRQITEDLRIRARFDRIQAHRIVRRQSAKGVVRPRDFGASRRCFWSTSRPRASISARAAKSISACAPSPTRASAVLVSSSDGIELEGLCDRVLIFARGRIVHELTGVDGHRRGDHRGQSDGDRIARQPRARRAQERRWRDFAASDHFPALVLAVLTIVILGGTQALNGYFLSAFSIKSMLSFFSILTFLSMRAACDGAGRRHRPVDRTARRSVRRAGFVSGARRR